MLLFSGDSRLLPTSWKREEVRVQGSDSNPSDSNQCLVKDTRAGRSLADCKKKKEEEKKKENALQLSDGVQVFQVNKLLSCSLPLQRETGDASKQNCVLELKGDVTDSRVSKETVFLPQLLSCHFLHYPRAPCTAAAVLPDSRRGKCDAVRVGNEKMCPLFLSTSLCSLSSSHFPLVVSLQRCPELPRAAVWHAGPPTSAHRADCSPGLPSLRPARCCSVL